MNLAHLYEKGIGLERDPRQAFRWYCAAASQGVAPAAVRIGAYYYDGDGVARDYGQAARWFGRAAEQGYAPAQRILAALYASGKGAPLDYEQAYAWYQQARARGDQQSSKELRGLSRIMTPRQRQEAQTRSPQAPPTTAPILGFATECDYTKAAANAATR
jgi:TPR repeat protein